ncbi:Ataxin-10 [Galemys pyrenaicus]|uniref:Ataxin-10 n=1 Tax=Galemys pyrenaicus TaxID=202257 RepID=A0A8J6AAL8_GALPY|nr:Ataxin-10 [Galemys pyrenaicus]
MEAAGGAVHSVSPARLQPWCPLSPSPFGAGRPLDQARREQRLQAGLGGAVRASPLPHLRLDGRALAALVLPLCVAGLARGTQRAACDACRALFSALPRPAAAGLRGVRAEGPHPPARPRSALSGYGRSRSTSTSDLHPGGPRVQCKMGATRSLPPVGRRPPRPPSEGHGPASAGVAVSAGTRAGTCARLPRRKPGAPGQASGSGAPDPLVTLSPSCRESAPRTIFQRVLDILRRSSRAVELACRDPAAVEHLAASLQLVAECFRCLRNACIECALNQDAIRWALRHRAPVCPQLCSGSLPRNACIECALNWDENLDTIAVAVDLVLLFRELRVEQDALLTGA